MWKIILIILEQFRSKELRTWVGLIYKDIKMIIEPYAEEKNI